MAEVTRSWRRPLLGFVVLLAATLILNGLRGAFTSDLCAFEDEPAHAVTGMMISDWLAAGMPSPLAFAKNYYLHYPKVAIGQWPPVFYVVQAVWILAFGASTASLVVLMSAITAAVAWLITRAIGGRFGLIAGLVAGASWIALPVVQAYGAMVMTEVLLALFAFLALEAFARFLTHGTARDVWSFGIYAMLACMTKGNALALALVPPVAIVLTRRFDALKSRHLWGSALLVGAVTVPWYMLTVSMTQSSWVGDSGPTLAYFKYALGFYGAALTHLGGKVFLALSLLGAVHLWRTGEQRERLATWIAWVPSLLLMHLVVPSSLDERHLILVAPVMCLFAVAGAIWAMGAVATPAVARAFAPLLMFGVLLAERGELPIKAWHGFTEPVLEACNEVEGRATLLVLSDVPGEGAAVVAAAQADRGANPRHQVLRASKVFARADWCARGYELRFENPRDVADWLDRSGVTHVLQDLVPKDRQNLPHHEQVGDAIALFAGRWERVGARDLVKDGRVLEGALVVWRRKAPLPVDWDQDEDWILAAE